MRVISLVPSLTETLAECGVNLVARTRFCVHPQPRIQALPVVGGTKDLSWDRLRALKPDLLILDKEENLPWMKNDAPCTVHVFHATSITVMAPELRRLESSLTAAPVGVRDQVKKLAQRFEDVDRRSPLPWDFTRIPGLLQVLQPQAVQSARSLRYVIWKNPWMRVGPGTYISSVLEKLGAGPFLESGAQKYPEFDLSEPEAHTHFYLFSSEPYPFARELQSLRETRVNGHALQGATVDGEGYSWFGIRGLRFLETHLMGRDRADR